MIPTGKAIRVAAPPKVDGVLDDDVWRDAPEIGDLRQKEPHAGQPASERTIIKLVYTSDALYIGIKCYERHPKSMWVVKQMGRDQNLYSDDRIEITMDPMHDRRNGYQFVTNPVGGMMDLRSTENTNLDSAWDGIWNVKTSTAADSWSAEFVIPFKTISFNPKARAWGFQFKRSIEHLNESDCWSYPRPEGAMHNMSLAGEIEGFEGLSQGIGLDVRPYGATGFTQDVTRNPSTKRQLDGGADVFYRMSGNMVATASINTDFSGTEADTRQINMTRFPLFFPEKRGFFLEDAGVFAFAPTANLMPAGGASPAAADLLPYYSRRIGMVNGEEAPIDFGAKLSGTVGRFTVGLLDMKTRDSDLAPGENLTVARMKTNFGEQSYIGALLTHGDPTGMTDNTVGGLDMKLSTAHFLGTKQIFSVTMFGLESATTGLKGNDFAWGGQVAYPNDFLNLAYTNKYVERNFAPALGYVQRPGTHFTDYEAQIRPRPRDFLGVRQMAYEIEYSSYYDLTNRGVQSRALKLVPLSWSFNRGSKISASYQRSYERLWEPFTVHTGVAIPTGSYWMDRGNASLSTPTKKALQLSLVYDFGKFYAGSNHNVDGTLLWRMDEHLTTSMEVNQYWVRLPQGDFRTSLLLYSLAYSFNPRLTISNMVQYDTDSQNVGVQSRLRWILAPGNELYVVINHSWRENPLDMNHWENLATSVRTKLEYTFRF